LSVDLADEQIRQLLQYIGLLEKWNKVYNLTAVREPDRMVSAHLLDSLAIVPHLAEAHTLVDVGTGAGLPGIPVAVACPGLAVTLLDTIAKKTTFVRQAISELRLGNAAVVTDRVEYYQPSAKFDIVISRAFAELKDFVETAGHLANESGRLLAMKGVFPHDEIARLPSSVRVTAVHPLEVPGLGAKRHLVVIEKN
jgi:16S rRNA (guanine527-N7)-methyltransferase